MSAIADSTDGPMEKVKVLFTLFPGYNTLDVAGPLEVLSRSFHDPKNKCKLPKHSMQYQHQFFWSLLPIEQSLTRWQPPMPLSASSLPLSLL